jgi:hypothetical protein
MAATGKPDINRPPTLTSAELATAITRTETEISNLPPASQRKDALRQRLNKLQRERDKRDRLKTSINRRVTGMNG